MGRTGDQSTPGMGLRARGDWGHSVPRAWRSLDQRRGGYRWRMADQVRDTGNHQIMKDLCAKPELQLYPEIKPVNNWIYAAVPPNKLFSSVQSLSHVRLFENPWTTACQASLSITNSQSLPKLMSIESVMPSNNLILGRPLLLLPSIFPSIRVFSNESALHIRWPKY